MTTAFIEGPLPILCSARIRLNEDQRQSLKAAYQRVRSAADVERPRIGGSTVKTVTAVQSSELDSRLGMSSIVVADLLNSRDTLSLPVVLKLQRELGVPVITKEQILEACQSYADYTFTTYG
jgi:hypothetical protein